MEGQLMAQVTIDDLDMAALSKHFSVMMQSELLLLGQNKWGMHRETVISSANRYILMRLVGDERKVLQVLITAREVEPSESLEVMANVEGAISAALH
jgi:hypothetical protein